MVVLGGVAVSYERGSPAAVPRGGIAGAVNRTGNPQPSNPPPTIPNPTILNPQPDTPQPFTKQPFKPCVHPTTLQTHNPSNLFPSKQKIGTRADLEHFHGTISVDDVASTTSRPTNTTFYSEIRVVKPYRPPYLVRSTSHFKF